MSAVRRIGRPRKAIVLAAGYGTRMLPLSDDLPKPLMPLWGRPLLEHTLRMLQAWGVRDVLLNCHHAADEILTFAASQPVDGLSINLSYEPDILGTGGVLQKASWFLDDQPCWMINGDIAADLNPSPLIKAYARRNTLASVWVDGKRGPRTVALKGDRVVDFSVAKPASHGTYTFCGLHLLSRAVLDYLPSTGFASIITAYEKAMKKGKSIRAICPRDAFWADMGRPGQYLDAHRDVKRAHSAKRRGASLYDPQAAKIEREIKRQGVNVSGFVALSEGVRLKKGATLHDVVAWSGATFERSAIAQEAIVARDATVRGSVKHMVLPPHLGLDELARKAVEKVGARRGALISVSPMGARASERSYTRIQWSRGSAMLVRYSSSYRENNLFTSSARFLRRMGVRVPAVLLDWPEHGLYMVEDVGDNALQGVVEGMASEDVTSLYQSVLDVVAVLHKRGGTRLQRDKPPMNTAYTARMYAWEHNLFMEQCLKGSVGVNATRARRAVKELAAVTKVVLRQPRVLIHRDLQSSNVIVHDKKMYLIDFQGMRMGPAAYDLASLLCDPYVGLSEGQQLDLLAYYRDVSGVDLPEDVFWRASIQRLSQALGAFGKLKNIPGSERFARYERPAAKMLLRALKHAPACGELRRCMQAAAREAN